MSSVSPTSAATGSGATGLSAAGGSSSVDGLVSGLNTTQIINQLMQIEQQPQQNIINQRDNLNGKIAIWQQLATDMDAIGTASNTLNLSTNWKAATATTSDSTIATVSTSQGALPGTLNFTVAQLAQANIKSSSGFVALDTAQAANANFLIAQGGAIGIGAMQGSGSLALGSHTFEVTQASSGASQSGTALADSVTVANGDTLIINNSGTPQTINLTAGTYTRRALADMISSASGGTITAAVAANKGLTLMSTREGSVASLQITGGVNLANLGFTAGAASNGTDGKISVDGVSNTVTDVNPLSGGLTTLNGAATDTVAVSFSGGLRVGTVTAQNVSYGDGTLDTVVANINSSGTGVTATAVQVASNQFKLQLTSANQGRAGEIAIDNRAFSGFLGSMDDLVPGGDAKIVVGSGANEYSLASSSNSVSNMLPGVTLNLQKVSTDPVTITVSKDYSGIANQVQALFTSVNAALTYIHQQTSYNATTKTAGTMLGDSIFQQVGDELFQAISNTVAKSGLGAASNAGITLQDDGTFAFDSSKFVSQFQTNPEGMAKLFIEGGTTGAGVDGTSPGIIDRLKTLQTNTTGVQTGSIWNQLQNSQRQITTFEQEITDWDVRLATKQQLLKTQFSNMEVALGQLRNTQSQVGSQFTRLSG